MNAEGRDGISHVFISRPEPQAGELAGLVGQLGLTAIVQPAFEFGRVDLASEQPDLLDEIKGATAPLLIFTSTRSVVHGLDQLPKAVLQRGRVAAIGPATRKSLGSAGVRVTLEPGDEYTSEGLLETLAKDEEARAKCDGLAFIVAAPGGREKLATRLAQLGWSVGIAMVYRSRPVPIEKASLEAIDSAGGLLSVWTSANAMTSLSQRLPPSAWFRLSSGEWLVISERLRRLARAYGPAVVHLASGPGNDEIVASIRRLL